jgi:nucleotide-binding universal stress UspA family protein
MSRIRSIVHATDFSKPSTRAFATALELAKSTGARLTLVTVVVPIVPLVPEQTLEMGVWKDIETDTRKWAGDRLKKLEERAKAAGIRVSIRLFNGDPAREITRAARAEKASLIVIGTHGRTGFSKMMLGSVAQKVIATALCPVVTVRSGA